MKKLFLLFGLILSMGMMAQERSVPNVSVVGEGKASVVPDQVLIKARVEHTGQDVQEVKQKNDEVVSQVIDFLKSYGIPEKRVKTEYIRLNRQHNYNTKEDYYSANQALSIHLDDLEDYEEVMGGLLDLGLNRIDNVVFQSSRQEELEAEARKKAMLNAREKAEQYAAALDQKIGKAYGISETNSSGFQPVMRVMEEAAYDSSAKQQLAPGEMEISVKVNVSFLLDVSY